MTQGALPAKGRGGPIAALDVGTTKVCCLIGRSAADGNARVMGVGHHASRGLRGGALVDLDAAEESIRAAVEAAERMAGETIRDVTVGVAGGGLQSRMIVCEAALNGHAIADGDMRRLLDSTALSEHVADGHELIQALPIGYAVDGQRGIRDPRGMHGRRLTANLLLVTAGSGAVRNLAACITRCHLAVADRLAGSQAAASSCLAEDERALGVTLIDMGGGTTSIAVFFDGEPIFTDSLPIGGNHVTNDIARVLLTPVAEAERLKTLYGNCLPSPSDDHEVVEVAQLDNDSGDVQQVTRSLLVAIVRLRLEETFEMVHARLKDAGIDRIAGRRVVLTGGGSLLPGTVELAGTILGKHVRVGRPRRLPGLPDEATGPEFATAVGLLMHAGRCLPVGGLGAYRPEDETPNRWARLGQWLRENF